MLKPEGTCFLIADISGYTAYLSSVEIDHAQDILADLIGTVVNALRPTFRLSKLEGDAAFCFAPTEKIDGSLLLDTIEHCYFGFRRRRRDVRQATSCECNACMRIPDLNLKFVAHHGLAIRQKIAGHEELLGSDVILVHRLLKNDVVEKLGVSAYALLTDALVHEMGVDPEPLGMRPHAETYEHIGEVKLWVHDLERRWQEDDARARVFVGPAKAMFSKSIEVPAPPQVVWEFVTTPGRRVAWQAGSTGIESSGAKGGRRGVGMTNHCMHGKDVVLEEIVDWRPFDYLSQRSQLGEGGPKMLQTLELEPTATGTIVHLRLAAPATAAERAQVETGGPQLSAQLDVGLATLREQLRVQVEALAQDRVEPPLPEPKPDGPLARVTPIQMVG